MPTPIEEGPLSADQLMAEILFGYSVLPPCCSRTESLMGLIGNESDTMTAPETGRGNRSRRSRQIEAELLAGMLTEAQIARKHGVSRERVRQIKQVWLLGRPRQSTRER